MNYKINNDYILINDKFIKINTKKNLKAKKIIIKFNHYGTEINLTIPRFTSKREGLEFINMNIDWLSKEIKNFPSKVTFEAGKKIPILGEYYLIDYHDFKSVYMDDSTIYINKDNIKNNNLKKWLIKKAKIYITDLTFKKASELRVKVNKISIRDPKTRWGSCGENGNVSFSWRLIFAPPAVIEYVVTHEVCHIIELNHSYNFWQLVSKSCPKYKASQSWLRDFGLKLHFYG
ncbi:M48 family metallopeptidase [Alphaproteobacteria bacterium]|nr:M48 family metallopeptidase [Alphaproteobacteria bacterium]